MTAFRKNAGRVLIILPAIVAVAMLLPQMASAKIFAINSTLDEALDPSALIGECRSTPSAVCTLRAAVQAANALAGPDKIVLKARKYVLTAGSTGEGGGTGEDAAAMGDLDITESLTIVGLGSSSSIVDGGHLDRVFHVIGAPTDVVKFVGITVQNGIVTDSGGGIFNSGSATVTIKLCSVINNLAYAAYGGGIASAGPLKIISSVIAQNTLHYVSASQIFGGGIAVTGPNAVLTVQGSKIANNMVSAVVDSVTGESGLAWGGGIGSNAANSVSISNSKIINNVIDSWSGDPLASTGGGLFISGNANTASVISTKIANNISRGLVANGGGAGILTNSATFSGCTITGNSANSLSGGGGGGFYLNGDSTMAVTINSQSRVVSNYAGFTGGGIYKSSSMILNISGGAAVSNNAPDDLSNF